MTYSEKMSFTLPYKLALSQAPDIARFALVIGHLFLAANVFCMIWHLPPVFGILAAAAIFGFIYLKNSPYSRPTASFSLFRVLFSISLFALLSCAALWTKYPLEKYWLLLAFTQTPLSLFDAYCIHHKRNGPFFIKSFQSFLHRRKV